MLQLLNYWLLRITVPGLYLNNDNLAVCKLLVILCFIQKIMYIYCCRVLILYTVVEENLTLIKASLIGKLLFLPRHWISSLSLKISISQIYLNLDLSILSPHYSLLRLHILLKLRIWLYFRNTVLALLNKCYGHFYF